MIPDAGYLTAALRAGGHLDADADVVGVHGEPLGSAGVGMAGHMLRLTLRYSGHVGGAPSTLVVKLPPTDPIVRAVLEHFRWGVREGRFYQHLADRIPVRTPRCYRVDEDPTGPAPTLLLEDLSSWLTVDQVDGADLDQAQRAVDAAAAFHAATWDDPALASHEWLAPLDDPTWLAGGPVYRSALPVFLDRFGHLLTADSRTLAGRIAERFEDLLRTIATVAPPTLCHGDYRLANLLFRDRSADAPDGVAVLDWQLTHRGPAAGDLAMLLTQSLPIDLRRRHEDDLIRRWQTRLTARAPAAVYPLETARLHYRLCSLFATIAPVGGGGTFNLADPRALELYTTLAVRAFTALDDLAAAQLIP